MFRLLVILISSGSLAMSARAASPRPLTSVPHPLSEDAKIEALLRSLAGLKDATFIRNGREKAAFIAEVVVQGAPRDAGSPNDLLGGGPCIAALTEQTPGGVEDRPSRGLGLRPTANTGVPLADAYLWVKTPGQSDGQCTRWGPGPADPVRGIVDPAAGQWFPDMALELARNANPPVH